MATYQRGKYWWYRFRFAGERIDEPTKSTSRTRRERGRTATPASTRSWLQQLERGSAEPSSDLEEIIDEYLTGYRLRYRSATFAEYALDTSAVFSAEYRRRHHRDFGSPLPGGPAPREGRAKVD